jgi:CBS domain-containing protein
VIVWCYDEGRSCSASRVGACARTDVPTCSLGNDLNEVRDRLGDAGWGTCFVVNGDRVALGQLDGNELRPDTAESVEAAMTPGPNTIGPSARVEAMVERMRMQNLSSLPVTTSDGRLVAMFLRQDAERESDR